LFGASPIFGNDAIDTKCFLEKEFGINLWHEFYELHELNEYENQAPADVITLHSVT
jgi:hypothetical protein